MQSVKKYFKFYSLIIILFVSANTLNAQTNPISISCPNFSSVSQGGWQVNRSASFQGNPAYLRLTQAVGNSAGSAFWKNKIGLSPNFSFSAFFKFQIAVRSSRADGITFCIQQATNTAGGVGGGIGYNGLAGKSIGIEYDTYDNGEVSNNHIALDINGILHQRDVRNFAPYVVGLDRTIMDLADDALAVPQVKYNWIDYDGVNNVLEIRISNTNIRPVTATTRIPNLNLSTIFPNTDVYFGFTSATGGCNSEHDILGVMVNNNYNPFGDNPTDGGNYSQAISNISISSSNDVDEERVEYIKKTIVSRQ
jgi:hypothetical protein